MGKHFENRMGLVRKCDVENTVVHAAKSISCRNTKTSTFKVRKGKVLSVFKHWTMKAYGGVDVWTHVFLTSALVAGEWSRLGRFTLGERAPGTHWIGGWVGPRAGLDDIEKIKFLILTGFERLPSVV
jgi:hypothetical protein